MTKENILPRVAQLHYFMFQFVGRGFVRYVLYIKTDEYNIKLIQIASEKHARCSITLFIAYFCFQIGVCILVL